MPPFVISNNKMFIVDDKGDYVELTDIKNIEITDAAPMEDQVYNNMAFGLPFEFSVRMKQAIPKGKQDILFGRPWTSAAYRYRRHLKRQKEKERRARLKHEACICSDVR